LKKACEKGTEFQGGWLWFTTLHLSPKGADPIKLMFSKKKGGGVETGKWESARYAGKGSRGTTTKCEGDKQ